VGVVVELEDNDQVHDLVARLVGPERSFRELRIE
jgi:hypothetical protein